VNISHIGNIYLPAAYFISGAVDLAFFVSLQALRKSVGASKE